MLDHDLRKYIKVYEAQLSAETCEDIIQRFETQVEHQVRRGVPNIKAFTEFVFEHLDDWADIRETLKTQAHACLKQYRSDAKGMLPAAYEFESYRIKCYQPNSGDVFNRHVDHYNESNALRFLVLFWYLNDVEEGGETWFPELKMRVRPRCGRVLMFPPFWMYEHAGLRPVSNTKYIVGSYFTFPSSHEA